jgi:hypothetical protein
VLGLLDYNAVVGTVLAIVNDLLKGAVVFLLKFWVCENLSLVSLFYQGNP